MGVRTALKAIFNPDQWSDATRWPTSPDFNLMSINDHFSSYVAIYRNSLAVRSIVSFKANNMAALPMKVYRRKDEDLREALHDHPLAKTLKEPNLEDTSHTFMRDLYTDLQLFDCTFWRKVRVKDRLYLQRMYPDAMTPLEGSASAPDKWAELQRDGTTKEWKRDDIFWLHGYGGMAGISPMESLRRELDLDAAEADYRLKAARKGWRTEGVIERPKAAGQWTPEARTNFMQSVSARYSGEGNGVGRPLLLEEDMHWVADPNKDGSTEYIAARSFTIKQACLAFRMAPQILGIEGAPYASVLEYKNQLYQIVLGPDADFIEQGVEKFLLPEFDDVKDVYVEFNMDAALRGDPAQQAAIAASAVGVPYWTPDEWRAKILNMGPMPTPPVPEGEAGANWYDGMEMSDGSAPTGGKPGPAPDPTSANRTPQPSDLTLGPLTLSPKAMVGDSDSILGLRSRLQNQARSNLSKLVTRMENDYNEKGYLDTKTWNGSLSGELQLRALAVSSAIGELAADQAGVEYNAAQTVAYWGKAAKEQAKATVSSIEEALGQAEADDVWMSVKGQLSNAADNLVVRASNWALLELGRQNGSNQPASLTSKSLDIQEMRPLPAPVPMAPPEVNVSVNIPPIDLPEINLTVEPQAINVTSPDIHIEPTKVDVRPELEVNLPPEPARRTTKVQRVIRDENNLIVAIETVEE